MIRVLRVKSPEEMERIFHQLQVDKTGIKIMIPKTEHFLVYVDALNVPAANILKQELLSMGADAALNKGACNFSVPETPCVLIGNKEHFNRLTKKLLAQPFGLKKFSKNLKESLNKFQSRPASISAGPYHLDFSKRPLVMGILNMTPDSFSGDGMNRDRDALLRKAEQLVSEGADILDIGGESTRPGATQVSLEEEKKRVIPAIKAISKKFKIVLSVDTSKPEIAKQALEEGAHLVNDVTGLTGDLKMAAVVEKFRCPAVVMHHRRRQPPGTDLIAEICLFFEERIKTLGGEGIPEERLILDPGIGFGKDSKQNLFVLKRMEEFKIFGRPLLLGPSRKSFIGGQVSERLPGTLASLVHGHLKGFHIFRVHDVKEAREALQLSQSIEDVDEG